MRADDGRRRPAPGYNANGRLGLGSRLVSTTPLGVDGLGGQIKLDAVTPAFGSPGGGTAVMLTGGYFLPGANVTFGGAPAESVTVATAERIIATTRAHAVGLVDVVVENFFGPTATLPGGFDVIRSGADGDGRYLPASGVATGGTTVTITGAAFRTGAAVTFGGLAAAAVAVVDAATITATTPEHAVGGVDVAVTNGDGQAGLLIGGFTYAIHPAPTVTAVTPMSGPPAGGTAVTITGAAFREGATVTFGGTPAIGATVVDETTITATTPEHAAGAVDVLVTNVGNQSGVLVRGFSFGMPGIATGSDHTCVVRTNGAAQCWGSGPTRRRNNRESEYADARQLAMDRCGGDHGWRWPHLRSDDGRGREMLGVERCRPTRRRDDDGPSRLATPVSGLESGVAAIAAGN